MSTAPAAHAVEATRPDPPPLATHDTAKMIAWAASYLDQTDWIQFGVAWPNVWLVSNTPADRTTFPLIRDWVRSERVEPETGGRSLLQYVEVDCKAQTSKTLQSILFPRNNLHGSIVMTDEPAVPPTDTAAKGSIRESFIRAICAAPA